MDFDPDSLILEKIRGKYSTTWKNLGPYAAELYLYRQLRMRIEQLKKDFFNTIVDSSTGISFDRNSISPEITSAEDILDSFSSYLEERSLESIPYNWYSSKVFSLVDIIINHPKPFQGIVFVEQRQDAIYLAYILQRIPNLLHEIRCAYLVGNGEDDLQSFGMTMKEQAQVLQAFGNGDLNLSRNQSPVLHLAPRIN
jgi:endoribonuclease Dicer